MKTRHTKGLNLVLQNSGGQSEGGCGYVREGGWLEEDVVNTEQSSPEVMSCLNLEVFKQILDSLWVIHVLRL